MPFGDFVNQIPPIGFLIVHVVLFAHTISEVLDLLAFSLVFVAATRTVLARTSAEARA